jgi:hypothetical protein
VQSTSGNYDHNFKEIKSRDFIIHTLTFILAFQRHRQHFSAKREEGARTMKGGEWGDLFTVRKLRVNVMGDPAPV